NILAITINTIVRILVFVAAVLPEPVPGLRSVEIACGRNPRHLVPAARDAVEKVPAVLVVNAHTLAAVIAALALALIPAPRNTTPNQRNIVTQRHHNVIDVRIVERNDCAAF